MFVGEVPIHHNHSFVQFAQALYVRTMTREQLLVLSPSRYKNISSFQVLSIKTNYSESKIF